MGRMPKPKQPAPGHVKAVMNYARAHALASFLFPEQGEWEWYSSPKGYIFLKIKQRKEQAA